MTEPSEPYRLQDGTDWGEVDKPVPTYGSHQPRRFSLAERVRLAARRRKVDPSWSEKSPQSRRLLLDRDREEGW